MAATDHTGAAQRMPSVSCGASIAIRRAPWSKAGGLITAREAERRVLVLENPGPCAASRKSRRRCYAGVQLVLPGEIAPAPSSLPICTPLRPLRARGAHTAVAGEGRP